MEINLKLHELISSLQTDNYLYNYMYPKHSQYFSKTIFVLLIKFI